MKYRKPFLILVFISSTCLYFYWFLYHASLYFSLSRAMFVIHALIQTCIYILFFISLKADISTSRTNIQLLTLVQEAKLQKKQQAELSIIRKNASQYQSAIIQELKQIQHLLSQNQPQDAHNALESLISHFDSIRPHPFCSDSLVNAILQAKREIAVQNNITVNYQVILPDSLAIPNTHLSSIFFNLLDNGIESCMRSNADSPFLNLTVMCRANFLHINMENSKRATETFNKMTSKKDTTSHGYGLRIIEGIANSYDGSCKWIDNGDTFQALVMLRTDIPTSRRNVKEDRA